MTGHSIEEHIHHGVLVQVGKFVVVNVALLWIHHQAPVEAAVLNGQCVDLEVSLQRLDVRHCVVDLEDRENVGQAQLEQKFTWKVAKRVTR